MPTKAQDFCFTLNNPTNSDTGPLEALIEACTYVIYGKEVGASGTPHYQGFCRFPHPVRLARATRLLPRAHFEFRRGTVEQAIEYCEKDGDFRQFGERPERRVKKSKNVWHECIEAAKRGDIEFIEREHPGMYVRYFGRWQSLRVRDIGVLRGDGPFHEWWYGPTGTGKSRALWELYPDHHPKALSKWWCGYTNQEVVAIEEFSPRYEMLGSHLKVWADRYPFNGEVKGGTLYKIRPKKLIVLSNYTIRECFGRDEDCKPLLRRFKVVHFPQLFIPREPYVTEEEIEDALSFL